METTQRSGDKRLRRGEREPKALEVKSADVVNMLRGMPMLIWSCGQTGLLLVCVWGGWGEKQGEGIRA